MNAEREYNGILFKTLFSNFSHRTKNAVFFFSV